MKTIELKTTTADKMRGVKVTGKMTICQYLSQARYNEGSSLDDVYVTGGSCYKKEAERSILQDMKNVNGYDYHICSHSVFAFSAAFTFKDEHGDEYFAYYTKSHKYIIAKNDDKSINTKKVLKTYGLKMVDDMHDYYSSFNAMIDDFEKSYKRYESWSNRSPYYFEKAKAFKYILDILTTYDEEDYADMWRCEVFPYQLYV